MRVAVAVPILSAKLMETPVPYIEPLCIPQNVGGILSIRLTVAMTVPVFPARSRKVKVKVPFPVKR